MIFVRTLARCVSLSAFALALTSCGSAALPSSLAPLSVTSAVPTAASAGANGTVAVRSPSAVVTIAPTLPPSPRETQPRPVTSASDAPTKAGPPGLYPDSTITPGAVDPNVTQANIKQTICTAGYTRTVRPPESYTEPLKLQQIASLRLPGGASAYEEDHFIPLDGRRASARSQEPLAGTLRTRPRCTGERSR